MKNPSKKNIQLSKGSASSIGNIEIVSEPKFYPDKNNENFNSIDKLFTKSLEKSEHLTEIYQLKYYSK